MQDSSELQLLVLDGRYKTTTVVAGQLPQWLEDNYYGWIMAIPIAWGISAKEWLLGDGINKIDVSNSVVRKWIVAYGQWHQWTL